MDEKIVQAVQEEIKKLGENSKANYTELRKNYEELKHEIDTHGASSEKVDKLVADITTRQEALDKKFNERLDSVEVAMQRSSGSMENKEKLFEEAKQFTIAKASLKSKDKPITYKDVENSVNVQEFVQYKGAFNEFLRCKGDERALSPEQFKLLQVGVDPDGGYLVTPAMSTRILQRQFEGDPIRQLASVQAITTESIEEWVDWGDAGAEEEGETVATTDYTTPTWNKIKISTHSLATRPRATQTFLEDAAINVETWLADKVSNKFARVQGSRFVSGDGVGKARGIITYANGTTFGTIEQKNMGNASAFTADGFVTVKYALKEQYLDYGTWLMNRSSVAATMKLKTGTGDYIWKPSMLANDPSSTLLGLPVRMSTTMPEVTTNSLSVALADWTRAYKIVDRIGITVLKDPYTVKPAVEFYFRTRYGGQVIDFDAIKIGKVAA